MANNYSPNQFREALLSKLDNRIPPCSMCGCKNFTMTDEFLSLLSQKTYVGISIGKSVPAGFIICTNCGHIEFFSLGILGLLNKNTEGDGSNG